MRFTAILTMALSAALIATPAASATHQNDGFVQRQGADLVLNGKKFHFSGTNNYYLHYKSRLMTDDVFTDAAAAKFNVIRTWGWLDIGNQDGSNSVAGKADGVYFQYWNGTRPTYNDGADGLERLDYVLYKARQAGIKLIIPFTNNWADFGGIDQYVRWAGLDNHDDFYTDPTIRGWYKDWIDHVLNRTNTLTGVKYKDDPTVMMWELGNEPRCKGSGLYPPSATCTPQTLTTWADEMTRFIKSKDGKHLVGVGDEGFRCTDPTSSDWTINCGEGVDNTALTKLPAVDVMSFHLYPDGWLKDAAWGTEWIKSHIQKARQLGKPSLLGEFGLRDKATRNVVYQEWTEAVRSSGGTGWLYWILSGIQDDNTLYPDYDGFTVYCPSPVCQTLTNAGTELAFGQRSLPPVADHDATTVEFGTGATLDVAANDIAYRTYVKASTIDLDPATAGRQTSSGDFTLVDGKVSYTPPAEFAGRATAHYTIKDAAGRTSNVANITVTVKPDPTGAIKLFSFEDGVQGWAPGNWQPDAGSVEQTSAYATDGVSGLRINSTGGAWFGATFPEPVNLANKSQFKWDLKTGPAGTSVAVALQFGPGFTWCQSNFTWANQDSVVPVEIDLTSAMSCSLEDLADVRGMFLWISPGSFDIDNIRAE
ncbi:cellulase family glycosylhydrolase [Acrocarpospora macrocephala]|uniref:mannan endo-1,4-beta-mannosidase n=1 Tax=Acrocarpospora macrocephala TaxID=150177 RepID=A0A5M3WTZ6_9ACTN|nr:cellulase family glycosylhydrolase [Acrocarpospora macrocephala]GES12160.1 endo-1,4-beta-mannosidase [Acrocarpospora macrocephala]